MTRTFNRYAVYVVPDGNFYDRGAAWLGWDSVTGAERAQPRPPGITGDVRDLTEAPRKYGFHGTIKPPFRLAEGKTQPALEAALAALARDLPPVEIAALAVRRLGGFVACVPAGPTDALARMAATVVQKLDSFRAPPDTAELARRRASGLTSRQEALLQKWGYPYVLDEFRFHLTLTNKLPEPQADALAAALSDHFQPVLPRPFRIRALCLLGEAQDGRFYLIHRYSLSG